MWTSVMQTLVLYAGIMVITVKAIKELRVKK